MSRLLGQDVAMSPALMVSLFAVFMAGIGLARISKIAKQFEALRRGPAQDASTQTTKSVSLEILLVDQGSQSESIEKLATEEEGVQTQHTEPNHPVEPAFADESLSHSSAGILQPDVGTNSAAFDVPAMTSDSCRAGPPVQCQPSSGGNTAHETSAAEHMVSGSIWRK